MYVIDGIAYAGEQKPALKVWGVRPMENHRLWVRFNTGEAKIVDFTPLLDTPAFAPLADEALFARAYIDYGVVCWGDDEIDIAPEYLYQNGIAVDAA